MQTAKIKKRVTVPQETVKLLIQEHELHPDNPYMFPSPVAGTMYHPDAVGRIHQKLLKEAGIEHVRFHDLRHTFATEALAHGMDVKTLSAVIGHVSAATPLDVYTHDPEECERLLAGLIVQMKREIAEEKTRQKEKEKPGKGRKGKKKAVKK